MERIQNTIFALPIMLLVLIGLDWWTCRSKSKASQASNAIPLWRRWRPGNPSRCDCCQAEAAQTVASRPKPPVEAWSQQRSKRGRKKHIDSAGHYCPNPECRYHENRDSSVHALVSNGHHGAQAIRQWVCQACGTYVSERHDTAISHLKTPIEDVAKALDLLNRGNSQADTADHRKNDPRSVRLWLARAAAQAIRIHDALRALGLSGCINTSFVERGNLTFRNLIASLHRRTWALLWSRTALNHHFTWFCATYHFVRPHMALAGTSINGRTFKECSPAIAAGLTDHLWSIEDLLTWRPIPVLI